MVTRYHAEVVSQHDKGSLVPFGEYEALEGQLAAAHKQHDAYIISVESKVRGLNEKIEHLRDELTAVSHARDGVRKQLEETRNRLEAIHKAVAFVDPPPVEQPPPSPLVKAVRAFVSTLRAMDPAGDIIEP